MSRILFLMFAGLVMCASQAMADSLKISVIGAGNVGGTLGTLWVKAGHSVMFSSRHPEELVELVKSAGANARTGSVSDAAAWGDVIVLSVPYGAMPVLSEQLKGKLDGKVVFSTSNRSAAVTETSGARRWRRAPPSRISNIYPVCTWCGRSTP